jgi:hypothetical protein
MKQVISLSSSSSSSLMNKNNIIFIIKRFLITSSSKDLLKNRLYLNNTKNKNNGIKSSTLLSINKNLFEFI